MNNDDDGGILNGNRFEFESNLMNTFRSLCNYSVLCVGHIFTMISIGAQIETWPIDLNQKAIRILKKNIIFHLEKTYTYSFFPLQLLFIHFIF